VLGASESETRFVRVSALLDWTIAEAKGALKCGNLYQREALAEIANFLILYGVVGPRSLSAVSAKIGTYQRRFRKGRSRTPRIRLGVEPGRSEHVE